MVVVARIATQYLKAMGGIGIGRDFAHPQPKHGIAEASSDADRLRRLLDAQHDFCFCDGRTLGPRNLKGRGQGLTGQGHASRIEGQLGGRSRTNHEI